MQTSLVLLAALAVSSTSAFAPLTVPVRSSAALNMADDADGPGKINTLVDLDSPKVVNMESLEPGKKGVYCRCWLSGTFPLCDGSHVEHNKEKGDNVGPLIVSVPKAEAAAEE